MGRAPGLQTTWRWVPASALVFFFLLALALRAAFLFEKCFTADYVNFQETDTWYHLRAVEHLIAQFPQRLGWDPYALHPGGQHVAVAPLYDLLVAAVALLAGLGNPSGQLTHAICAVIPPVLGAFTTIPAYFLGKRLGGRTTGIIAAAALAFMPGPLLRRSLLGYNDHHVAESLFSLATMLFIIRSHSAKRHDGGALGSTFRGLMSSALAGAALGAYLLTWVGGSLLVFILFAGLSLQLVVDHLAARPGHRTATLAVLTFLVALLLVVSFGDFPGFEYHILSLVAGALLLAVAGILSRGMSFHRLPRWQFPFVLLLLAAGTVGISLLVVPHRTAAVFGAVRRFAAGEAGSVTIEAGPLAKGIQVFAPLWEMFGIYGVIWIGGLLVIGWRMIRYGRLENTLVFVWSLLMFLLTLRQVRFAYYFGVNIALLVGVFWGSVVERGIPMLLRRWPQRIPRLAAGATGAVILFGWLMVFPVATEIARQHTGPSRQWHEALEALRTRSPEPFGSGDYYYQNYASGATRKASYGVMCWWDYGYWISAIARRVPVANPTQAGAGVAARFFTAPDEEAATAILDALNVAYVVVDGTMAVWETETSTHLVGKFSSMVRWAELKTSDFFETYAVVEEDGSLTFSTLYYPAYYRTMLARLFAFEGRAVTSEGGVYVIQFSMIYDAADRGIKKLEQARHFANYDEANRFVHGLDGANWRIVGLSPLHSCVPLPALRHFRPIHVSASVDSESETGRDTEVAVFEYTRHQP